MPFLMVPITNSIDKWVIFGKKLIFRNFHPKFSIGLTLDSYLSHPNALLLCSRCYIVGVTVTVHQFFCILHQNITAISALQNDTSFAFLLLCKRSQLTVLSENLQFEMNIADFWRKLIKGLYKPKLNIKTCFL